MELLRNLQVVLVRICFLQNLVELLVRFDVKGILDMMYLRMLLMPNIYQVTKLMWPNIDDRFV